MSRGSVSFFFRSLKKIAVGAFWKLNLLRNFEVTKISNRPAQGALLRERKPWGGRQYFRFTDSRNFTFNAELVFDKHALMKQKTGKVRSKEFHSD